MDIPFTLLAGEAYIKPERLVDDIIHLTTYRLFISTRTMTSRHHLTLKKKIQLINDSSGGNGLSQRTLAERYNISLGSVSNILKRKEEYLHDYETNQNQNVKRKFKSFDSVKLDQQVYEWFVHQRSKNIPISGTILQEKAREIAKLLGDNFGEFKASNGWLEKFRRRHNISHRVISGESSSVDITSVNDWIQRLPNITEYYEAKNIFNCDETGLFYKLLPDKSLTLDRESCKGGKKSKDRISILFCCNSTGEEKLKPLVIGKSLKPRCFKNINVDKLPVHWYANKSAWMNTKIFDEWLLDLNLSMKQQNRKIILFMDNAPCHPTDIELSHVKLQFFPPNTTSKLQPLDQGIIRSFKTYYRKQVVKYVISRCATAQSPDDIKITPLDAIYWVDASWQAVSELTIRNTFRSAGFENEPHGHMTTTTLDSSTTAPTETTTITVDEYDEQLKILDNLLQHITIGGQAMKADDFVEIDNDIPAFNEWFDSCENILVCDVNEQDDDDSNAVSTEIPPKITEAMEMTQKLRLLATTQYPQLHKLISELESKLIDVYIDSKKQKQTTIENFFK
ncbi:unnamed protein product [Rotaria sordida]|uniref:HTH CENPB-type domain-containing protein n=3 Tax=Rotaria sordida TaxID=392033 RepID=A0A820CCM8_9BILA|nr:unnamed protein product [Rotaria sordida]